MSWFGRNRDVADRGDDEVDDFDAYDPTPYGGGYDLALTYGRPLPPSDDTCHPVSTSTSSSSSYNRPHYSSGSGACAYDPASTDSAFGDRYGARPSHPRPKPHAQPQPAYDFHPQEEAPHGYGRPNPDSYGSEQGYGRPNPDSYGSGGYGRPTQQEGGYGRPNQPSYGTTQQYGSEYGSGYGRPNRDDEPPSYGSGYGRPKREDQPSYGYSGYEEDKPKPKPYGYGASEEEGYGAAGGGGSGYGVNPGYGGGEYQSYDKPKPSYYGGDQEGYGRKKHDDDDDDSDEEKKHRRQKHQHHRRHDYDDE
ncbi:hypothetical protein LUZ62_071850 [Rhynchospora pubera]|uniref:Uncharacterized protein n=1 Tax=Rhynchospora pubera TaxID=906938 RepID=A0AAV8D428_9POAL|nr:hypothetical protein LUZ62_071850 [Rhynchospora pubera]